MFGVSLQLMVRYLSGKLFDFGLELVLGLSSRFYDPFCIFPFIISVFFGIPCFLALAIWGFVLIAILNSREIVMWVKFFYFCYYFCKRSF